MRFFRAFSILLTLAFSSFGVFIVYHSLEQPRTSSLSDPVAGAVLCSLALTLLDFPSRSVVQ
jgi:hypothetical protein